ncbi:MAG: alkaline phosphatase PhoX [Nitrospinota bacterium]
MSSDNEINSIMRIWVVVFCGLFLVFQCGRHEMQEPMVSEVAEPAPSNLVSVEFTHTEFPPKDLPEEVPYSKSVLRLKFKNGKKREISLGYNKILSSGDSIGGQQVGLVKNVEGKPITEWGTSADGLKIRNGTIALSGADGNSLLLPTGKTDPLYLVTHFEHRSWVESDKLDGLPVVVERDLPLAMNLTRLEQNPKNGKLKPLTLKNIDMSGVGGLWYPCSSSRTPWNTHLGSEEYEPDAKWFEHRPFEPLNRYFGTTGKILQQGGANPYNYGFPVEVSVDKKGNTKVKKRYAMGRISLELGLVMPDEKTVYLTDDGYDVVRLMFVADRPRDLSSGTLYAAKWNQTSAKNGGRADLQWIRLGHGDEKKIRKWIDKRITFSDIFDWQESSFYNVSSDYKPIYVFQGFNTKPEYPKKEAKEHLFGKIDEKRKSALKPFKVDELDKQLQYLKVKPGMEEAATFLETRRYAGLRGATTEFTKLEGQALNVADRKLYTVSSKVKRGAVEGKNGSRPQDHIKLKGKKGDLACGVIYESDLKEKAVDHEGRPIASTWVAVNMKALLSGRKGEKKKCDPDTIGNPDNIVYSEKLRHLLIAEDSSGRHPRDFLWAYSIDTKKLSRILVAPKFSEISGLHVAEDVNGFWYLFASLQKDPNLEFLYFGEPRDKINNLIKNGYMRGISGYLGPANLRPPS